MNEAPSPKAGYKSTEFWVTAVVATVTLIGVVSGDMISPEEQEAVGNATAQLVDSITGFAAVVGPIIMTIYYTISRGKLKSNTVRYLAELAGGK